MPHSSSINIRPLTTSDVARLPEIDANFESPIYLDVIKETNGVTAGWRLVERPFVKSFVCNDFNFDEKDQEDIRRRLKTNDGLWLVAENTHQGRLVGVLDAQREAWRDAVCVWNLAIDRDYRGQGLGRALMERLIAWGREQNLRAIILETQSNNWPACRFYRHFGFQLSGIDDHYYTNQDVANKEVALFWTYEL